MENGQNWRRRLLSCAMEMFFKETGCQCVYIKWMLKTAGTIQIENSVIETPPDQYPERWKGFGCIG
ncbi:MAG: hypothetical protein ACLR0B_16020 [Anaerobutyricum soehngenii]